MVYVHVRVFVCGCGCGYGWVSVERENTVSMLTGFPSSITISAIVPD